MFHLTEEDLKIMKDYLKMFAVATLLLMLIVSAACAETASWYAKEGDTCDPFPHEKTASGEKFSDGAMTAAMWGVKFGTRIRVTNLANGRSIIVRINDRGPSKRLVKRGRVIDLAKAAFAKLAKLDAGVIKVRLQLADAGEEALVDGKGKRWYESEDGRYYYDNDGNYLFKREEG